MKFLVAGSGFSGATVARLLLDKGHTVDVIERRDHVGGTAHTPLLDSQHVHWYGPHIFHTNDDRVWEFINKFAEFERYTHQVKAIGSDGRTYSLPFTLQTFNEIFGTATPAAAQAILASQLVAGETSTLEGWCLANIGTVAYELLVKGYTKKQWNKPPTELPSSLVKRLPLRFTFNTDYFTDKYQGIPVGGYTQTIEKMLVGANVTLGSCAERSSFSDYDQVFYCGCLDELCDYEFGRLEYRSLRFDRYVVNESQGCAQLNDCRPSVPHTRTIESWLFSRSLDEPEKIWHVKETPDQTGEPCYPSLDGHYVNVHRRYVKRTQEAFPNVVPVGRLATYRYLDMHQAIGQAMKAVRW